MHNGGRPNVMKILPTLVLVDVMDALKHMLTLHLTQNGCVTFVLTTLVTNNSNSYLIKYKLIF